MIFWLSGGQISFCIYDAVSDAKSPYYQAPPPGDFVSGGESAILNLNTGMYVIRLVNENRGLVYQYISAQLPFLLISDNRQLTALNRSIYENQNNGGHFKNFLFLLPTAILLALGAAMVAYGLYCCPPMRGVLLILFAGVPISAAVWCFFFRVIGI